MISVCKIRHKKTPQMVWNVLGKNWEGLGTFGKILGNIGAAGISCVSLS